MKNWAAGLSSLALSASSLAQSTPPQTQIEISAESSHLSNASPDWRAKSVRLARKLGPRDVKELTLTHTSRFGLDDQQISGAYAVPVSDRLTATLGASISPSHRVLARHGLEGALQYEFAPGWLAHAGLGHRRYDTASVRQASVMLERYFSSFSLSAAWRPVRALGANASSAELRGTYYYAEASSIGLVVSSGQEATSVNAGTVVLADVRAAALLGRHQLNRQWSLSYALSRTLQGQFYNQSSVRLGAQYIF
ncbi:MAG: YaiO family outer membrane beta-barrel protein [Pseudomonadota bacterium]|nr:YaiO family outer membrane beta-barrel protein [Pseudomonadota bacterium]